MILNNAARLALAGILLVLVVLAPFPGQSKLVQALHNAAHGPIFGIIAVVALQLVRSRGLGGSMPVVQYAGALSLAVLLGAATELIQIAVGRDASLLDLRNDFLGAAAFLAGFAAFDAKIPLHIGRRITLVALGAGLFILTSLPAFEAAFEQARREAQFPILVDFESRLDDYYMSPQWAKVARKSLPAPWSTSGEQALHVAFDAGPWPGLAFIEPSPNWSGYSALCLDVTNPTDSRLELVIRVHDWPHDQSFEDRFNERHDIAPHSRVVLRIPLARISSAPRAREMDIARVAGLILFETEASTAGEMYLSRIWLEGQ